MIRTELIKGQYMYTVTDSNGNYIAETYSIQEAEQIQKQTEVRKPSTLTHIHKGQQLDPIRSK